MTIMTFASLPIDIVRHILASATAPTLCRFAGTCRAADDLVVQELNFRYDFVLTKYIADRPAFRTLLGATSSNIAGSLAALVCGIPTSFIPGDLDVYCDADGLPVLRDHLVGREFYEIVPEHLHAPFHPTTSAIDHAERLVPVTDVDRVYRDSLRSIPHNAFTHSRPPSPPNDPEYSSGIADVVHLRRGDVYIDLIASAAPSSVFPIVNFWSTAPMCFLTDHGLHILYPRLQELNRALLNPHRLPPGEPDDPSTHLVDIIAKHKAHTRNLIAKYVDRGYDVQHTEHVWDPDVSIRACMPNRPPTCPLATRWVGDSSSMHFSLRGTVDDRSRSSPEELGLSPITCIWSLGGSPCGPFCSDEDGPVDALAYTARRDCML